MHLYDNSTLDWHLENGTPLKIVQKTNYPWDGDVKVTVISVRAGGIHDVSAHSRVGEGREGCGERKSVEGAQAG